MRATVFKELLKEIETNKIVFQKIQDMQHQKVYKKWDFMIAAYYPSQERILQTHNIDIATFNKNPDQEYKVLFNELYSKLALYTFGIQKLNLFTPKKVKDFLEFYGKSFNNEKLEEIINEMENEANSRDESLKVEEFRKEVIRRMMFEIQMKNLSTFGRGDEAGWVNMMISTQLFFITYDQEYVAKVIQKQKEIYEMIESSFE